MIERARDVLWRVAPGFLVVATLDDVIHEASGPAPDIWQLIGAPIAFGELIAALADAHDLPPAEIRDDLTTFVTELVDRGLVVVDG